MKMKLIAILEIGLMLFGAGLLLAQGKMLQVKGSDTMVNMVQILAEEFMAKNPKMPIAVLGGGSGTGITALINGTTDVCDSSRDIKTKEMNQAWERGVKPRKFSVAVDGLSVIVNAKNPLTRLTMIQVGAIYRGEIKNWKAVGGPDLKISLYGRQSNSGTYSFFQEHVLGNKPFSTDVKEMNGSAQIIEGVLADEAAIGLAHLANFQDVDKPTPVILTTSQLLTTGVDAEMVKNVVLARVVGSRPEFKQIIGRGTRLNVDYGKEYFNILDFTGTATRHFADPDFDGEPALIEEAVIDEAGEQISITETVSDTPPFEYPIEEEQIGPDVGPFVNEPPVEPRKFYIDGGEVEVIGHLVYDLDADGKKLQVVKYTEYSGRALRSLYPNRTDFQNAWANPDTRAEVLRELTERGISFGELSSASGEADADPFDLLCHLAWNAPLLTRRQRAEQAKRATDDLFVQYGGTAREILAILLDKYIERGILQFNQISELFKVQPLDRYGKPSEIANQHFGGIQPMRQAINRLQAALYQ